MLRYLCPNCSGEVGAFPAALICERCGWQAPIVDGIVRANEPVLMPSPGAPGQAPGASPFPGGPSLSSPRDPEVWSPWFYEDQASAPERASEMFRNALDPRSAAGVSFLPAGPGSTALELRSGLGGITRHLGWTCGQVVSISRSVEELSFARKMAEEEGLGNVTWMEVTSGMNLPFASRQFDLVIAGDLLRWAESTPSEDPGAALCLFLQELYRVLVRGGFLAAGVPNRWASRGLPGSLWAKKTESGFSRTGYQTIVEGAGFDEVRLISVGPDHRFPHEVHDPAWGGSSTHTGWAYPTLRERIKASRWYQRQFSPGYLLSGARRGRGRRSMLEEIVEEVARGVGGRKLRLCTLSNSVAGIVAHVSGPDRAYVMRVGLYPDQKGRVRRNAEALRTLPTEGVDDSFEGCGCIPGLHYLGATNCHLVSLEDRLEGVPADVGVQGGRRDRVLHTMIDFLVALGGTTRVDEAGPAGGNFMDELERKVKEIGAALPDRELSSRFQTFWEGLSETLERVGRTRVWAHGDFNLGNVLLTEGFTEVSGVVDWDQHMMRSPPGLDVINLILALRYQEHPSPRGERIVALCQESWLIEEQILWGRYFEGLGLDVPSPGPLIRIGWINSLWNGVFRSARRLDYTLIQNDVGQVLRGTCG